MSVIQGLHGKVWLAMREHLLDWSETRISWPDESFAPSSDEAYLIIDPVFLDNEQAAISDDCGDDNRGFLNIRVMTPFTYDYAASLGLMGRIGDWFPSGWVGVYDDARARVYRQSQPVAGNTIEASWRRKDIRIHWQAFG